jgi:hypothetical protein
LLSNLLADGDFRKTLAFLQGMRRNLAACLHLLTKAGAIHRTYDGEGQNR